MGGGFSFSSSSPPGLPLVCTPSGWPNRRRSRPEFAYQRFAAGLYEVAQCECDDHDVVELTGDRDEVRDEVEGEYQVTEESEQDQLPASRYTRVASESADEDDAVRDGAEREGYGVQGVSAYERRDMWGCTRRSLTARGRDRRG